MGLQTKSSNGGASERWHKKQDNLEKASSIFPPTLKPIKLLLSVWGVDRSLQVEKVPFAGLPTWRMRAANHIRGLHEAT